MKKYTKEEAIFIAVNCAKQYESELNGKNLLFICINKRKKTVAIEFSFHSSNYMHLTGLKPKSTDGTNLFANDFYRKCLAHKLSPSDFDFADDGTTHMKLEVLPAIICKNLHANIIGDYNSSKPRLHTEKVVGSVRACMGFVLDKKALEYIPNTVIKEDARDLISSDYARVVAVFRKERTSKQYNELTYKAKKANWSDIDFPKEFSYLSSLLD